MNNKVIIIGGILLAAVAGYLARGLGSNSGAFMQPYQLCYHNCEKDHTTKLNEIYAAYDLCMDTVEREHFEAVLDCRKSNTQELIFICLSGLSEGYNNEKNRCRKTRNDALTSEEATFANCRAECKKLIPSEFRVAN